VSGYYFSKNARTICLIQNRVIIINHRLNQSSSTIMISDSYVITEKTVKEPPTTFLKRLKFLGPGFILSASIVGSGELIATTALGAKAGFIAFWIIIVSC